MESRIGILHIRDDYEQKNKVEKILKKTLSEHDYSLIEIKQQQQIGTLDGLIIDVEKSADYAKVFQWLIDIREEHSLFIWILVGENDSELLTLYPQLSKNSVIEIIRLNQEGETLGIVIKNALNYKNLLLNGGNLKNELAPYYLDESKLSLEIHDKTIELTVKEFKIIKLLYENMGNLLTYSQIAEAIDDTESTEKQKKYRIANFIFHIRSKLKKQSYFEIKIIRTKGYLLTYSNKESLHSAINANKNVGNNQ